MLQARNIIYEVRDSDIEALQTWHTFIVGHASRNLINIRNDLRFYSGHVTIIFLLSSKIVAFNMTS